MLRKFTVTLILLLLIQVVTVVGANPQPEWIEYGDRLTSNGNDFFYTVDKSGDDATPCTNAPQVYIYGTVPHGGGEAQKTNLLTGCDVPQASVMVADNTYLYYVEGFFSLPGNLYRMPLLGGPPENMLLTSTFLDIRKTALAHDATHIYFATGSFEQNNLALWKADKVDRIPIFVAEVPMAVANIGRFALDDDYIYWTESNNLDIGAVRAVHKNGGAIFTAAENSVEAASDILVDGDYVYWTELGGDLRRRLKTGGAVETLHTNNDPLVSLDKAGDDIVVGAGYENGSLWRYDLGSDTETLMYFGGWGPQDIHIYNNWVYWARGSVQRLPLSAVSDGVDYVIEDLEITQAIQDGSNTVRLVTNKPTVVRAYGRQIAGSSSDTVKATLRVYDSSGSYVGALSTYNNVDLGNNLPDRDEDDDTFTFIIPPEWVEEDFEVQVEVNAGKDAFELNYDNNDYPVNPTGFTAEQREACLVMHSVVATDNSNGITLFYGAHSDDADEADSYFNHMVRTESYIPAKLYPEHIHPETATLYLDEVEWTEVLSVIVPYDITSSDDRAALKADLIASKDWSDAPERCGTDFTAWAGLVDPDANTADPDKNDDGVLDDPFTFGGQGWSSSQTMWAKINDGGSNIFSIPIGSRSIAHEIGHVFGRPHVDCGNPANPGFYPYNPCQLDDNTSNSGHWGYDYISRTAIDPATTRDLMAYGGPRWTSDYTWDVIYDRLDPNSLLNANYVQESITASPDILWVRGIVDNDDGVATLYPTYHLPLSEMTDHQLELYQSMPSVPDSDFAIVLMDGNDQPITSQPIPKAQLEVYDETLADPMVFHVALQLVPNTASVRLVRLSTNAVLDSWDISPAAPDINVTNMIVDDANEEIVLEWSAGDTDGDDLYFMVQYSYDGDRKQAIMIDRHYLTAHETLRISTKGLSGKHDNGPARIQLFVSDGVNTTSWLSYRFTIPGHDPVAHIDYRGLGNGRYALTGTGTDIEDGLLPNGALVWSIDGEQVVEGSLSTHLITVPEGETMTVQLTVTDSDGQTDTATVRLESATSTGVIYLPLILRN